MNTTTSVTAQHRLIHTSTGEAVGAEYAWIGGQYCAIHAPGGVIGCGIYDLACADEFNLAVAIANEVFRSPTAVTAIWSALNLGTPDPNGVWTAFRGVLWIAASIFGLCQVPLIASGGAGAMEHFRDAFTLADVDGALAASVFHKGLIPIPELKRWLKNEGVAIRE